MQKFLKGDECTFFTYRLNNFYYKLSVICQRCILKNQGFVSYETLYRLMWLCAGPCPPCPQTVIVTCHCKKKKPELRRCGASEWSCGKPCMKTLACGHHQCNQPCHQGEFLFISDFAICCTMIFLVSHYFQFARHQTDDILHSG